MVDKEKYIRATGSWYLNVARDGQYFATNLVQIERAPHGAWFITFEVDATIKLKDGRQIVLGKRQVRLRAHQDGMRPRTSNLPKPKRTRK